MRVIAGEYKGRILKAVSGKTTRPTSDKLKEAIFHKLGPFFDSGTCLDLFAGSGALGIEALSRGMNKVIFIDKHPNAVRTIKENTKSLKVEELTEVYRNDAFRAIQLFEKKQEQFDLIILDPPYDTVDYQKLLETVQSSAIVKPAGVIYIEHRPAELLPINEDLFKVIDTKQYSSTTSITILQETR